MPRPRQFDEERAVQSAMHAFWVAGYEATSTQDLCAATGLGRSSVYNTFRSKHDLFERSLAHYMDEKDASLLALLDSDLPAREKVRQLLGQVFDETRGDPPGCLVVNTMVELAPRDPEIATRLQRNYERRHAVLRAALDSGRRTGELDAGKDPDTLAHFVLATITGLQVMARSGADRGALEAAATTALTAL